MKLGGGGPFTKAQLQEMGRLLSAVGFDVKPEQFVREVVFLAGQSLFDVLEGSAGFDIRDGESLTMRVSWAVREKVSGCALCESGEAHRH